MVHHAFLFSWTIYNLCLRGNLHYLKVMLLKWIACYVFCCFETSIKVSLGWQPSQGDEPWVKVNLCLKIEDWFRLWCGCNLAWGAISEDVVGALNAVAQLELRVNIVDWVGVRIVVFLDWLLSWTSRDVKLNYSCVKLACIHLFAHKNCKTVCMHLSCDGHEVWNSKDEEGRGVCLMFLLGLVETILN